MALPTKSSPLLHVKDMNVDLSFQSGQNQVPIHTLSPDKQRHHILETIVEVYEYKEWSMLLLDWSYGRQVNVRIPFPDPDQDMLTLSLSRSEQRQHIFHPFQDDQFPWPCGTFVYEVDLEGQTYYGAIRIVPHHFSKDQFNDIATYLEQELDGLTMNYYKHVSQYISVDYVLPRDDLQFLQWLDESFVKLTRALKWIEQENQSNVKRHYQAESRPGRMDRHSVKWKSSFKGAVQGESKFYNRKQIQDFNLPENQMVKYRVKKLLQRMDAITASLQGDLSEALNETTETRQNVGQKRQQIEERIQHVQKYAQKLRYQMRQPSWNGVEDTLPRIPSTTHSRGYISFHKLWHEQNEWGSKQPYLQHQTQAPLLHPTAKIYEYYTLLMVVKQFLENGYESKHDTIAHQLKKGYLHSGLQEGTTVILEKADQEIHIVYDQDVEYRSHAAIEKKTYFFSKFRKRKPDIRIDYYRKENGQPFYHSSVVIEVKYSPLRNIYSEYGHTKAAEQMNEYIGIKYYCPVRKEYLNRIHDVICVYPGNRFENTLLHTEDGKFLQFYPTEEGLVGGDELYDVLWKWLGSSFGLGN